MASYVLSVSPFAGFTVAMGMTDLLKSWCASTFPRGGGDRNAWTSGRVLSQPVEKRGLRLDDHGPGPLEAEPLHPVQLGELAHLPGLRWPLDAEHARNHGRRIDVRLDRPRRDDLAVRLPDLTQRYGLPVGRRQPELLLELAAGRGPRPLPRPLGLAPPDRP